jgi:hypothetical protein
MARWACISVLALIGVWAPPLAHARLVNTADSLVITSPDTLQLKARHYYNAAVLIVQGGRLFVTPVSGSPGDSSGLLWLNAPLIQVLDSAKIIADGRGYRGGNPEGGNGLGPGGGRGGLTFAGGGGGGYGGSGGRGGPANGGGAGGPANDSSLIFPGSGGGAGNQGGGAGGRGGGAILLMGDDSCTITGTLSALGENADPTQIEGGGGGSGGGIYLRATFLTLRGVVSSTGGYGGDGGDNGGGGGGGGRLRFVCWSGGLDTTGIRFSVAGGQGGYATIGEPGLPGNPGTVDWWLWMGVEEKGVSQVSGVRSSVAVVPNPSRGQCEFRFSSVPREAPLALELYDPIGRLVRTLDAGPKPSEVLRWDGRDEAGREISSGVYFYRTRDGRTQGKVLVLR